MITINNLTVSYTRGKNIIDSLNISLEKGKIHGLVGLNGAGKTTLLYSIFGLKPIDDGTILMNNQKVTKREISFLETENFFYSNITAREYLSIFKFQNDEIEKWNKLFSLPLDAIIDGFSTGMKKKLAFMALMKQDKPIFILDEPFNGLDIETCRIIRQILFRLKERNKTIIITSHIIETLTNLCDYIHYLENGKINFSKDKTGFKEFENEIFTAIENKNRELIDELI